MSEKKYVRFLVSVLCCILCAAMIPVSIVAFADDTKAASETESTGDAS